MKHLFYTRFGFTLMELILVVAVISVIAAVAMPAFFTSGSDRITQARISMLKARHTAIRAAVEMSLRDDKVLDPDLRISGPDPDITNLVDAGYLEPGTLRFENTQGQEQFFALKEGISSINNQLPPILREKTINIVVKDTNHNIDKYLRIDNLSWQEIWTEINQ